MSGTRISQKGQGLFVPCNSQRLESQISGLSYLVARQASQMLDLSADEHLLVYDVFHVVMHCAVVTSFVGLDVERDLQNRNMWLRWK